MGNIIDYVKWRGDLSLDRDRFHEIDALILARISYFPLEDLLSDGERITLRELGKRFEEQKESLKMLWPDDAEFIPVLAESTRFSDMVISDFINQIDLEVEKQFCAVTVQYEDRLYLSFRGTDSTMVGWKEDFNMGFASHLPAQIAAKEYTERIAAGYPEKSICLGGHSKGGNIAIYAALFAEEQVRNRIAGVYNFDGPGFLDEIVESTEYRNTEERIHSYIPQGSIVGRLMGHREKLNMVTSTQKGIMQHDIYSWNVLGKEFVLTEIPDNDSVIVDKALTKWIAGITVEDRRTVIDTVYRVISSSNASELPELKENLFQNISMIMNTAQTVDKDSKDTVLREITSLIRIGTAEYSGDLKEKWAQFSAGRSGLQPRWMLRGDGGKKDQDRTDNNQAEQ